MSPIVKTDISRLFVVIHTWKTINSSRGLFPIRQRKHATLKLNMHNTKTNKFLMRTWTPGQALPQQRRHIFHVPNHPGAYNSVFHHEDCQYCLRIWVSFEWLYFVPQSGYPVKKKRVEIVKQPYSFNIFFKMLTPFMEAKALSTVSRTWLWCLQIGQVLFISSNIIFQLSRYYPLTKMFEILNSSLL